MILSKYTLLSTSTVQVLNGDGSTRYPGIVLLGGIGSGKTAIIEQLVANSCFLDSSAPSSSSNPSKHPDPQGLSNGFNSSPTSTLHGTQVNRPGAPTRKTSVGSMSVGGGGGGGVGMVAGNLSASVSNLNYASLQNLGSQVVAFHMCQADNNITCMVPDFVHSLSAYLTRAPQLQAYRDLLTQVGSAFSLFTVTPFLLLSVCLRSHPFCCLQSHPFCFQSVYSHTFSAAFSRFTVTHFLLQSVYSHTLFAHSLFTVTPFLLTVCLQSHPFCSRSVYSRTLSVFSLFMVTPFLLLVCIQTHLSCLQCFTDTPLLFAMFYRHTLSVLSVFTVTHPFCSQCVYRHTPFLFSVCLQSHTLSVLSMFTVTHFLFAVSL